MSTLACWLGIVGAVLLAMNIKISIYAYIILTCSSLFWIEYGIRTKNNDILAMNIAFFGINILGVIRWLQ